jgi:hypothetical protein
MRSAVQKSARTFCHHFLWRPRIYLQESREPKDLTLPPKLVFLESALDRISDSREIGQPSKWFSDQKGEKD